MKYQVVTIFDRAAEIFNAPAFFTAVGVAVRTFSDQVNDPNNPTNKHPEDFSMYHLGEYDDQTAEFTTFEKPIKLATAKDYIQE